MDAGTFNWELSDQASISGNYHIGKLYDVKEGTCYEVPYEGTS